MYPQMTHKEVGGEGRVFGLLVTDGVGIVVAKEEEEQQQQAIICVVANKICQKSKWAAPSAARRRRRPKVYKSHSITSM
jgi:hypothetical protein